MNLFNSYSSLIKSSGAGDKVFGLLDRKPPAPGTGSPAVLAVLQENDADEEADAQRTIEFRNVSFFYPSRPSHNVLKGLNLVIPAGKTLALVGSSGCGKSTVIGLLQRYFDPTDGAVLLDDTDLRSIDIWAHRRHIGTVTQDPVLFSGTILSNILYGSPSATLEQAIEAAKLANAHGFISSFPEGYYTQCGERGIALSGGQKQRIAIARAIVKRPSTLLLDEATSSLDAGMSLHDMITTMFSNLLLCTYSSFVVCLESEHVVQEALDKLLVANKGMTTVIVAHRLRTVRNADKIAYLENGVVAEEGTHEELMKKRDGRYRKMVERAGDDGNLPDR